MSPDFSTWLTKDQAAARIGVSTKTVEKLAQDGKLQQASWKRATGGPARVVYHPDDVARLATERRPGAAPFVLPPESAGTAGTAPQHGGGGGPPAQAGAGALAPVVPPTDEMLRMAAVFAAAVRAVTSQSSQKGDGPVFLTLEEAAAFTGLSQGCLRRMVDNGTLTAVRDRGLRLRRRDLEAL